MWGEEPEEPEPKGPFASDIHTHVVLDGLGNRTPTRCYNPACRTPVEDALGLLRNALTQMRNSVRASEDRLTEGYANVKRAVSLLEGRG
jgi:hypothetical protein